MLPWLEAEAAARPALDLLAAALGEDWRARLVDTAWSQSNAVARSPTSPEPASRPGRAVGVAPAARGRRRGLQRRRAGRLRRGGTAGPERRGGAGRAARRRDGRLRGRRAAGLLGCPTSRRGLAAPARAGAWRSRSAPVSAAASSAARAALAAAAAQLAALGAKTTPLSVRVASHTPAMRAAVPALAQALARARWRMPRVAWVAGITRRGRARRRAGAARARGQVATTIRWDACMDTVAERRPAPCWRWAPARRSRGYGANGSRRSRRARATNSAPRTVLDWLAHVGRADPSIPRTLCPARRSSRSSSRR